MYAGTSGGKTLVADLLMLRTVLHQRLNCLFVLPYISIVAEKMQIFAKCASEFDFVVEAYAELNGTFPPKECGNKRFCYVATIDMIMALVGNLIEPRNVNFDFSRSFIRFTTHVNNRAYIIRHNEFRVRLALFQSAIN